MKVICIWDFCLFMFLKGGKIIWGDVFWLLEEGYDCFMKKLDDVVDGLVKG